MRVERPLPLVLLPSRLCQIHRSQEMVLQAEIAELDEFCESINAELNALDEMNNKLLDEWVTMRQSAIESAPRHPAP